MRFRFVIALFLSIPSCPHSTRAQQFETDPIGRLFNGVASELPDDAVIGNFDGDPQPDLMTGGLELTLWGVVDGKFVPDGSIPIAGAFFPRASARMNDDSYPDLVGTNGAVFAIVDGRDHGFGPELRLPAGAPDVWDAIGDIDGDGLDDLVVGEINEQALTVFRNRGDHFEADRTMIGATPIGVALGDMDSDGDCDAVVLVWRDSWGLLLLRNVAGHIQPDDVVSRPADQSLRAADVSRAYGRTLRIADVDEDGHLDVLTVGIDFGIYWNDGTGRFSAAPDLPQYRDGVADGVADGAVADLDGDGTKDLVVIARHDLVFQVEILHGDNRHFVHSITCFAHRQYASNSEVLANDFDGDGQTDILVLANPWNTTLFRGRGPNEFGQRAYLNDVPGVARAWAADFEGRSRDAVLESSNQAALYYDTNLDGTLASPVAVPAAIGFEPIDLTGDGRDDLIRSTNTAVIIRRCLGGLSFSDPETLNVGKLTTTADFNGDGILDLLVESGNELKAVPGLGGGTFGLPGPGLPPTYLSRRGVAAADVDGNGVADLASVEVDEDPDFRHMLNRLVIYRNDGAMAFVPWNDIPFVIDERYGMPMQDVLFLKLNDDALPDIAVRFNATGGELLRFGTGDGDGHFVFVDTVAIGSEAHFNRCADLDQDGRDELIVTCFSPGSRNHLFLFSNQGGYFGPGVNICVGGSPRAVDVGDFNGDGAPDLVQTALKVWDPYTESVTVHLNGLRAPLTPVAASVVTSRVASDCVSIEWYVPSSTGTVDVERRRTGEEWRQVRTIRPELGRVVFEDRDVAPGREYSYRLAVSSNSDVTYTQPLTLLVPGPALSLRAKPGRDPGRMIFAISTTSLDLVEVEIHDLQGRRIAAGRFTPREVGESRDLELRTNSPMRAGVFWATARQGDSKATAKIVRLF